MADKWRVEISYLYRRRGVRLGMEVEAETREIAEMRGEAIVKKRFPAAQIIQTMTQLFAEWAATP